MNVTISRTAHYRRNQPEMDVTSLWVPRKLVIHKRNGFTTDSGESLNGGNMAVTISIVNVTNPIEDITKPTMNVTIS